MRTFAGMGAAGLVFLDVATAFAQPAAPSLADAGPNDLRVYAVTSIRGPLVLGLAGAEQATGKHIVIEYGSARGNLKDAILAGKEFDIALLLPDVNAELAKAGKVLPQETVIGDGPMAFALRGDANVDVSSPVAITKTLLGAKSVKFGSTGSGMPIVQNLLAGLGIADKIKHVESSAPETPLAGGEYEILLFPLSEVIANKKVKNLGVFPAPWNKAIAVRATVSSHVRDRAGAAALLRYLTAPQMTAILTENGWPR